MPTIKVLRNGQLTLPARFRKVLELKQGDLLNAELEDNKIVLKPVTTVEREKMKEGAKKGSSRWLTASEKETRIWILKR